MLGKLRSAPTGDRHALHVARMSITHALPLLRSLCHVGRATEGDEANESRCD